MDFASLMSAQIAKSQQKSPSTASASGAGQTKYAKRSEQEAARAAEYEAKQAAREAERLAKAEKKRQLDEEEAERAHKREAKRRRLAEQSRAWQAEEDAKAERARRKRLGLPELPAATDGADEAAGKDEDVPAEEDVPEEELVAELRARGEPARLFGETHGQRVRRLQRLVSAGASSSAAAAALPKSKAKTPLPTTLEPVPEADMKIAAALPAASDAAARLYLSRQLTSWFTLVLQEWALALAARSDETKKSLSGQAATRSMVQAIDHLRPLFRKLERVPDDPEELPDDLFEPMVGIIRAAQERRYVEANDGYLQLSIGNAAWPIGVTMVGIHARSAREKLHETGKGKAHIMADEETRKILQSIKRCLTFAQTRWPPEDVGQLMG